MLTLTAEIGAQMEVTFEKAFRCVVTQQRINGCAGYLSVEQRSALINYGHYCIVVARLINKLFPADVQARAALYRRAAQYCKGKEQGQKWAEAFQTVAGNN